MISALVALILTATPYGIVAKYAVGGDGGWDYLTVDAAAHRLYVSRSTRVVVVSTITGKQVGEIPNTPGVHGIAIASKLGKGYTSNGRDNSVTIFNLKTLATIGKIPVGQNPDAIMYDAPSHRVITCNGRSQDLTFIDADKGAVVGTVKLTGKPEEPATDGKTLFVNIEDKSTIERVDMNSMKVLGSWPIAPVEEASGLAFDAKHHLLFAVGSNKKMAILDSKTGKVVDTPAIGDGPDGAGYDAKRELAFSSNGEGTLTILKRNKMGKFDVVQTVPTMSSARTMFVDQASGLVYLSAAKVQEGRSMVPGSFVILVVGPSKG